LKIIKYLLLILFILLQLKHSGYGQVRYIEYIPGDYIQYTRSDYLAANKKKADKKKPNNFEDEPEEKTELESPLRRFEITFFISAPFVFILAFATLHSYDVIKKKDFNVNVWNDYKPALLISTFGISSAIAAREAWITMEENDKKKEQSFNNLSYYFYMSKKF
jgi:hypothetical protein